MAAATEQILLSTSTRFGRQVVAPFQMAIGAADEIHWSIASIYAGSPDLGQTMVFDWRMLTPDGEMLTSQERILYAVNGNAIVRGVFALREGFLLSFSAHTEGNSGLPGFVFVQATVARGSLNSPNILAPLVQGYPSKYGLLSWPGSPLDTLQPQPTFKHVENLPLVTAGTSPVFQVPALVMWRPVAATGVLSTSVTAGNRQVVVRARTIANSAVLWNSARGPAQGASTSIRYSYGIAAPGDFVLHTDSYVEALADRLLLRLNDQFQFAVLGMAVDDQWSDVTFMVEASIDLV